MPPKAKYIDPSTAISKAKVEAKEKAREERKKKAEENTKAREARKAIAEANAIAKEERKAIAEAKADEKKYNNIWNIMFDELQKQVNKMGEKAAKMRKKKYNEDQMKEVYNDLDMIKNILEEAKEKKEITITDRFAFLDNVKLKKLFDLYQKRSKFELANLKNETPENIENLKKIVNDIEIETNRAIGRLKKYEVLSNLKKTELTEELHDFKKEDDKAFEQRYEEEINENTRNKTAFLKSLVSATQNKEQLKELKKEVILHSTADKIQQIINEYPDQGLPIMDASKGVEITEKRQAKTLNLIENQMKKQFNKMENSYKKTIEGKYKIKFPEWKDKLNIKK